MEQRKYILCHTEATKFTIRQLLTNYNQDETDTSSCLRITILRGNHESRQITQVYGFYGKKILNLGPEMLPWGMQFYFSHCKSQEATLHCTCWQLLGDCFIGRNHFSVIKHSITQAI